MRRDQTRNVSRVTRDTMALVLAGGRGSRLHELTDWRAKPALYFGGKFRIIDFPLSNCINSGIRRVGVLTQYKAHSLIRHLVSGWSHFKRELGESVEIMPASQRGGDDWYLGTADAIFQNLDIIRGEMPKYILVLSGDHIYKMDYGPLVAEHARREAAMTVCCLEVPVEEAAGAFGVMAVDEDMRVKAFEEKPAEPSQIPGQPGMTLASMGNYVFDTEFLFDLLQSDADTEGSSHDFGNDIIPRLVDDHAVYAYPFRDMDTGERAYWRDVGTLDSYWEANMELVAHEPALDMYDQGWPIWTYQAQMPPAKFVHDLEDRRGMAVDSCISGGVVISGSTVRRSVLFTNVRVNSHAVVEDSVVLPEVEIGRHCRIRKAIIDRGCSVPPNTEIGMDPEADKARGFRVTDNGVTLVTRKMLGLPDGYGKVGAPQGD